MGQLYTGKCFHLCSVSGILNFNLCEEKYLSIINISADFFQCSWSTLSFGAIFVHNVSDNVYCIIC